MKKKILLGISTLFICFILWFFYAVYTEKVPEFFPLDDKEALYTVTTESTVLRNSKELYVIHYSGKKAWTPSGPTSVMVGISKVALKPFFNKQVIIQGSFQSETKQCIVNECQDIGGPVVVINIDAIHLK